MNINTEFFSTLGQIAGIGGLSIALLVVVFRSVIAKKIFPSLTKEQAFRLLRLTLILSFIIGVIGIVGWIYIQSIHPPPVDVVRKLPADSIPNGDPKENNHEVIRLLPLTNLENKLSSFDLNPGPPIVNLRFRSIQWNIDFTFKASTTMNLDNVGNALLDHFEIRSAVQFDLSNYSSGRVFVSPAWGIKLNQFDISPNYSEKTLAELGVKDNDVITFAIGWALSMQASAGNDDEESVPGVPQGMIL